MSTEPTILGLLQAVENQKYRLGLPPTDRGRTERVYSPMIERDGKYVAVPVTSHNPYDVFWQYMGAV